MFGPEGKWLVEYMGFIKGGRIVDVRFRHDDELGDFPVLIVKPRKDPSLEAFFKQDLKDPQGEYEDDEEYAERMDLDKKGLLAVEFHRDEEGNGPGWPAGIPMIVKEPAT